MPRKRALSALWGSNVTSHNVSQSHSGFLWAPSNSAQALLFAGMFVSDLLVEERKSLARRLWIQYQFLSSL